MLLNFAAGISFITYLIVIIPLFIIRAVKMGIQIAWEDIGDIK